MSLETDLHSELLELYQRAGKGAKYWAHRFLRSVRKNGGLATAKRMLGPRTTGQRVGLNALLKAGKPELTMESVILEPRFAPLFTDAELEAARQRLVDFRRKMKSGQHDEDRLYPDELEPGATYSEGARRLVRVNAFERDRRAREACLAHYGFLCSACGVDFAKTYGPVGKNFIHVHHLRPIALTDTEYELNPIADLRPVCPNCHAMLHRPERLLTIDELKQRIKKAQKATCSGCVN